MDFADALLKLKNGRYLTRKGWNGPGQYVFVKRPLRTDVGAPTVPHLLLLNCQLDFVPWIPSTGDLFADDWEISGVDEDMSL